MTAKRLHSDHEPDDQHYDTIEEAIAAAIEDLEPGGVIDIHAEDCEMDDEREERCTCTPMRLTLGAKA